MRTFKHPTCDIKFELLQENYENTGMSLYQTNNKHSQQFMCPPGLLIEERVWHPGPPPHVGWWNASRDKDLDGWRWWDGAGWSVPTYPSQSPEVAEHQAGVHSRGSALVEWTDYWPENARVPRTDPSAPQVKPQPPLPGQWWEEHDGWYAGIMPALDGNPAYHLIVDKEDTPHPSKGGYGFDWDEAMYITANNLPSKREMALIVATCFEHMTAGELYWTSTQCSANTAWYQSFDSGGSHWDGKDGSLRVRPVRRVEL